MSFLTTCSGCKKQVRFFKGVNSTLLCQSCGSQTISIDATVTIECSMCGNVVHAEKDVPFQAVCPSCKNQLFIVGKEQILEAIEAGIAAPRRSDLKINVVGVVICYNLFEMTQHCVDRLRLAGVKKIVLVDNGSEEETIGHWAKEQKDILYIRNQVNLGCAIARNQGAKWANGEFIFFIDNDQFVPANIIDRMLNVNTDLIGVDHWIMGPSAASYPATPNDLIRENSYVGAGGLLIKKATFMSLGGFDERFAPAWFEDADFCFRARNAGYTIGRLINSGVEHLGGQTTESQQIFSSIEAKRRSSRLFLSLWQDPLSKMFGKKVQQVAESPNIKVEKKNGSPSKPKIQMVVDVHNWAWDIKARAIIDHLSDEFDFRLWYGSDDQPFDRNCDLNFTFEVNWVDKLPGIPKERIITGVTAHVYKNMAGWQNALMSCRAIHANSMLLYNELKGFNKNLYYVPNGVNHQLFKYKERDVKLPFTAGFVGKAGKNKGYAEIIEPAIRESKAVSNVLVGTVARKDCWPHGKMPEYYNDVDVILIASETDGTPNMLLEAAATGRTFIGNKIGNIPEFFSVGNGFMIEKKLDLYIEQLVWLRKHRDECREMGIIARETVEKGWTWEIQSEDYRKMFRECLT